MFKPARLISVLLFCVLSAMASTAMANPSTLGWPSFDASKWADSGLYVWHDPQGNWRLRLIGGTRNHEFTGTIWASKPFWSMGQVGVQGQDTVKRPSSQAVQFNLKVNGSNVKGLDFTLPGDAGICLYGWGTLGKTVYIGGNRTKMNTDIDLRGTGACNGGGNVPPGVGGSTTSPAGGSTGGGTQGGLKYNPGHYIAMTAWDSRAMMIQALKPGVRGVHKRYQWKELEPTQGNYNFSAIAADLQIVRDHGAQLVVIIEDKTFNNVKPLPPYMDRFNLRNTGGGWTAKRWDPYVVSRMAALTRALGNRFDSDRNFEGIALQETAPSLSDAVLNSNGYTPEKYRDALIQMLINTRNHFPRSQVFWYMNFLPRNQAYIRQIANRVAQHKVAMGGPDVLPDSSELKTHTYPFYREFRGKMTLFVSMQYDSYAHLRKSRTPTKYWTMPEMFRFARDQLHVNYMFWTREPKPRFWDSYDWTQALPVIRNNPNFNQ